MSRKAPRPGGAVPESQSSSASEFNPFAPKVQEARAWLKVTLSLLGVLVAEGMRQQEADAAEQELSPKAARMVAQST
jgi:hypothetical protein